MMTTTFRKADLLLRDGVRAALEATPKLDASMIGLVVKDSIAVLSGYVTTYAESLAATRAARSVAGIRGVANELEVRLAGERVDPELAMDAVQALQRDVRVPRTVIVTVHGGYVALTGRVAWSHQKDAAEYVVRHLAGVRGVFNYVVVEPGIAAADIGLDRRVAAAR